ncbi:UNVERIFIED_CONTAM: hypothetical protein GTU68_006718 [Idotea baltica]|nr:hypothetical protein [Idotea baltica]
MLLLRRFEEKAGQLYGMGLIGGFCHLYIGQEAIASGMETCLKEGDNIITSYRDHGVMLARGCDPKVVMAELLGREGGCSKGKGGSMHMFDLEKGFYGGHGIVAAQVPLGTGMAFAHKYKGTKNLSVAMFGDGAMNQGQIYESFNMAGLWNLPVLYILENNEYSMGTASSRGCSNSEQLHTRSTPYGIPSRKVDGMDFFAVREAIKEATDEIRAGKGPQFLEMMTYRYRGHSMSDPAKYREKDEVEDYKNNRDPIMQMEKHLRKEFGLKEADFDGFEADIQKVVKEAVEFAKNSPEPSEDELWTDIYTDG